MIISASSAGGSSVTGPSPNRSQPLCSACKAERLGQPTGTAGKITIACLPAS